jgi:hypothetical protein
MHVNRRGAIECRRAGRNDVRIITAGHRSDGDCHIDRRGQRSIIACVPDAKGIGSVGHVTLIICAHDPKSDVDGSGFRNAPEVDTTALFAGGNAAAIRAVGHEQSGRAQVDGRRRRFTGAHLPKSYGVIETGRSEPMSVRAESERVYPPNMLHSRTDMGLRRKPPEQNGVVRARSGDMLPIWCERCIEQPPLAVRQRGHQFAALRVPNAPRPVMARGHDPFSVRTKTGRDDAIFVSFQIGTVWHAIRRVNDIRQ